MPSQTTAKKPTPTSTALGFVPEGFRPYLELIRVEKVFPLSWLCLPWGLTMAAYTVGLPPNAYFTQLAKALASAFLLRSSGCTINDIFDRNLDAGVQRSKTRPLPSGRISVLAATLYLFMQYALGVAFFYYTERGLALRVALFQLLPLPAVYPLLKHVTYWPQAWLALVMNLGFVTAWISVKGTVNYPLLMVALTSGWCWTMLYDTIYACQDIRDDVKMGVHSTAILFGSWIRPVLIMLGIAFVSMLAVAGVLNGQSMPYFLVSVGGTVLHLVWQVRTVDLQNPESCRKNFNSNGKLGLIVWGGLMLDYVLSHHHSAPRRAAA
ncbi:UbiA prenyltransferase family [Mycena pura]|uniref:UbiA prenyltransferase family n=1 Tax=Mycena pura TaxID=153505 RepID=A0AAD6VM21_9AGAR|nr:UbiA prenyltransferase family [Mycena pura]